MNIILIGVKSFESCWSLENTINIKLSNYAVLKEKITSKKQQYMISFRNAFHIFQWAMKNSYHEYTNNNNDYV